MNLPGLRMGIDCLHCDNSGFDHNDSVAEDTHVWAIDVGGGTGVN